MNKIFETIYRNSFFRYIWTGGLGFILDMAVLLTLYELLGFHYQLATFMGFMIGLFVVYLICNLWVFNTRRLKGSPLKEFAIFALIGIIGLAWTHLLMWYFFEYVGIVIFYSKCLTTILVLMWNYGARKIIIY